MLSTLAPGVHVEWRGRTQPVAARRTDIAGFVGIAEGGPLHKPMRVESWEDFLAIFGRPIPHGFLAYAVRGFFANGGRRCWVVRVAAAPDEPGGATTAVGFARVREQAYRIRAKSPGSWGNRLRVSLMRGGSDRYTFICQLPGGPRDVVTGIDLEMLEVLGKPRSSMTREEVVLLEQLQALRAKLGLVDIDGPIDERELRDELSNVLAKEHRTDAESVRKEKLEEDPKNAFTMLTVNQAPSSIQLRGGDDGVAQALGRPSLRLEHLIGSQDGKTKWGLATLEEIDEVSIVAIPDIMAPRAPTEDSEPAGVDCDLPPQRRRKAPSDRASGWLQTTMPYRPLFDVEGIHRMQGALISHCERLGDRFAILDPPLQFGAGFEPKRWIRDEDSKSSPLNLVRSAFAAFYFPAIAVPDPLRVEGGVLRWVPPCGHIAGVYAWSDLEIGVHKPPANRALEQASSVAMSVDDASYGALNSIGVNVLRAHPGRGVVVGGARTLSLADPFRFINVRRLMIAIREWIEERAGWIVFEPHSERLWPIVERVVRTLLDDLWTRGMLDGATVDEAYTVVCDDTTNPPERRELGRVVCLVGVRLPRPVELVWVRIAVGDGGVMVSEDLRGLNA